MHANESAARGRSGAERVQRIGDNDYTTGILTPRHSILDSLPDDPADARPIALDPPATEDLIATEDQIEAANLSPHCIVRDYLYADVGTFIAPGGTGKTTLLLWELICIAIGRWLYGLPVESPGWTLYVTAEDARERLLARFREIRNAMALSRDEYEIARRALRIWDVTGSDARLVTAAGGNIVLTALADRIVEAYRDDPPAIVIFDPLVSFGASEEAVNTNEQALVTAARRIVRGLNCCVRAVHHTGKLVAREGHLDQYAGRGGSALADGARMVAVLQPWRADSKIPLPPGCQATSNSSVTILSRPKLSYAPPNLPLLFVCRTGFQFETFTAPPPLPPEEAQQARADQLERYLVSQLKDGKRYTATELERVAGIDMSRAELRAALAELRASGRVIDDNLPKEQCQGKRKTYLNPAAALGRIGCDSAQSEQPDDPIPPAFNTAAALRERDGGRLEPPISPSGPSIRRQGSAEYGGIGGIGSEDDILEVTI